MTNFNQVQPYSGIGLTVDGSHSPNGNRWSIAIIDTGIDLDHPFFVRNNVVNGVADRIVFQRDYYDTDGNLNAIDTAEGSSGHGSGVAGMAAGYKASGSPGPFRGVATGADIIALKVFPDGQTEVEEALYVQAVINALTWVRDHKDQYNIAAVNMSFGNSDTNLDSPTPGAFSMLLGQLEAAGVIVVASAGNENYNNIEFGNRHLHNAADQTNNPGVQYPAADPDMIAVSAIYDTEHSTIFPPSPTQGACNIAGGPIDCIGAPGQIPSFSQRGNKTDTLAPGLAIYTSGPTGGLVEQIGTSFAVPIVSGMAVLAQEMHWKLTGTRLKTSQFRELLRNTGPQIVDSPTFSGPGDPLEIDEVSSTGLTFRRADMMAIADKIVPPKVAGVTVLGQGSTSYAIPAAVNSAEQVKAVHMPNGINQIQVHFTEHVTDFGPEDVRLNGVDGDYAGLTVNYQPSTLTATITIPQTGAPPHDIIHDQLWLMLDADGIHDAAGNRLDGGWTNPTSYSDVQGNSAFPSGGFENGQPLGSDFNFAITVFVGDTNDDGIVDITDLNNVRNNFGGTGLGDTDWDNDADIVDLNNVRNNFGTNFSTFRALPPPPNGLMMMSGGGQPAYGEAVLRAALRDLYLETLNNPSKSSPYDDLFGWNLLGDAAWWKVTLGEI